MCAHLAPSTKYDEWQVSCTLVFRVSKSSYVYGDSPDEQVMAAMNSAHITTDTIEEGFADNVKVILDEDYEKVEDEPNRSEG